MTEVNQPLVLEEANDRFLLKARMGCRVFLFLMVLFLVMLGAISGFVFSLQDIVMDLQSTFHWLQLCIGLLLGGVAALTLKILLHNIFKVLLPSYIEKKNNSYQVVLYNSWSTNSLRRSIKGVFPLGEFTGVALSNGQGSEKYDTQIFLRHSSGRYLGTGWSGDNQSAKKIAEQLLYWLELDR